MQLLGQQPGGVGQLDLLRLDSQAADVHAREVEQVRRELRQPLDLPARGGQELAARLLVEILVGEQLEEAREREEGRAELVRRVRDELLARRVELRDLDAHAVEGRGELAELVVAAVDDRLVEVPLRDPIRGPLQPADAPRVHRCRDEAQQERDPEPGEGGVEHAALDESHGRELVGKGRRDEHDRVRGHDPVRRQQLHGCLAVLLLTAGDACPHRTSRARRLARDRVSHDLGGRALRRVGHGRQRERAGKDLEDDDPHAQRVGELANGAVEPDGARQDVTAGQAPGDRVRVRLELLELGVDQVALERGHDDRVRGEQGAADDADERQRQLDADATGEPHPSRKR